MQSIDANSWDTNATTILFQCETITFIFLRESHFYVIPTDVLYLFKLLWTQLFYMTCNLYTIIVF